MRVILFILCDVAMGVVILVLLFGVLMGVTLLAEASDYSPILDSTTVNE